MSPIFPVKIIYLSSHGGIKFLLLEIISEIKEVDIVILFIVNFFLGFNPSRHLTKPLSTLATLHVTLRRNIQFWRVKAFFHNDSIFIYGKVVNSDLSLSETSIALEMILMVSWLNKILVHASVSRIQTDLSTFVILIMIFLSRNTIGLHNLNRSVFLERFLYLGR